MHYRVLAITSEDPLDELRKYNENAEEYYKWYSQHADEYFETKEEAIVEDLKAMKDEGLDPEEYVWENNPHWFRDWWSIWGRFKWFFKWSKDYVRWKDLNQDLNHEEFYAVYCDEDAVLHQKEYYDSYLWKFEEVPEYKHTFNKAVQYGIKNNLKFFVLDLHG